MSQKNIIPSPSFYSKKKPSEPDTHDLIVRLCANGSNQIKEIKKSQSLAYLAESLCITMHLAADFHLFLSLMDAVDSCENDILREDQITYTYPPFCIEWTRSRNPIMSAPNQSTTKLVVQDMSLFKGEKPIEKLWNDRLHGVLKALGIKRFASDHEVFIWYFYNEIVVLNLSTDYISLATNNE